MPSLPGGTSIPRGPLNPLARIGEPSRDADALDRMVSRDQVPEHAQVPPLLADRPSLLRRVYGHGRMDDAVVPRLDLDLLHVVRAEDVRDECLRVVAVLDDVNLLVHPPPEVRDVLAPLPDRPRDVPFLDDEDQAV